MELVTYKTRAGNVVTTKATIERKRICTVKVSTWYEINEFSPWYKDAKAFVKEAKETQRNMIFQALEDYYKTVPRNQIAGYPQSENDIQAHYEKFASKLMAKVSGGIWSKLVTRAELRDHFEAFYEPTDQSDLPPLVESPSQKMNIAIRAGKKRIVTIIETREYKGQIFALHKTGKKFTVSHYAIGLGASGGDYPTGYSAWIAALERMQDMSVAKLADIVSKAEVRNA